jgi:hypothetical protein
MRRTVAALCLAVAMSAHASSYLSEISDLWYAPGESGWGVNMVLQYDTVFATFYVYDVNRNPVWFTAVLTYAPGNVFSGNLFADRGPFYGGAYDQNTVTERQAGTATFTLTDIGHGTLTYTIDGITVTKQMERLTFKYEDFSGNYLGGFTANRSGCTPTSLNGVVSNPIALTVTQTGANILMVAMTNDGGTCSFDGTYSQTGKLGAASGTFSCSSGSSGAFIMSEMAPTIGGFTAHIIDGNPIGQNPGCQMAEGFIGGVRSSP